ALPKGHRLARRDRLALSDLAGEAWVQTSEASACARHVLRICRGAGFEPRVSFESDDYLTVQGLVAAGVGGGLIPPLALSQTVSYDLAVRELHPAGPTRHVVAATPGTGVSLPAAGAMLDILLSTAARYRDGFVTPSRRGGAPPPGGDRGGGRDGRSAAWPPP